MPSGFDLTGSYDHVLSLVLIRFDSLQVQDNYEFSCGDRLEMFSTTQTGDVT
jgi:hypothetical protein